ncbi:hypothetical protein HPP92_022684 [Vanilla planifolia]|uniref:Uncharacterized protein n=1 Tax=Vanilla planifolia TaxID=51239 RepID=A0A835PX00_VANPL|nr:hypothetical protein HPP92_022684 [Vanilla planifolia]
MDADGDLLTPMTKGPIGSKVEQLARKYEDKYKQMGDVASKLTLDQATFRDIQVLVHLLHMQEKKMELYSAIAKWNKDRAEKIQTDLDELVQALNERCKEYGLRAKPTSLMELPFGWQPGIQEGAADWDERWTKFDNDDGSGRERFGKRNLNESDHDGADSCNFEKFIIDDIVILL